VSTAPRLRLLLALTLAGASGASAPVLGAPPEAPSRPPVVWQAPVNGPCRAANLVVGAPYATVDGRSRAGVVAVRYDGARHITWLRSDRPGPNAGFGGALASGDFNGDHCADLAVGVPDQVFGTRRPGAEGQGAVQVFLGTPAGFRPDRLLTARDVGRPYGTDRFGAALTAADLDDDGDDELAVGAPGLARGGGIAVFGEEGRGLRPGPLVTQRTGWVGQEAAETDGFGTVLASGDFDGRGGAEIAVGAPGDGAKGQGAVTFLDPLAGTSGHITQASPGIGGEPERLDNFGAALAAGDFDRDGRDELAIGIPGEDEGRAPTLGYSQGAVQIVDAVSLRQIGRTWKGRGPEGHYDRFGAALAAGDLAGDGTDDLVVGAPGQGAAVVLRGARADGITERRAATIRSSLGPDAQFGWALAVRRGDLLVGAPGAAGFGGAALVVRGTALREEDSAVQKAAAISGSRAAPVRVPAPLPEPVPLTARGLLGYSFG
jgi:hypothetical protein